MRSRLPVLILCLIGLILLTVVVGGVSLLTY